MFELTELEKISFNEKRDIINDMIRVFGDFGRFPTRNIYNKFTLKEFISPEFHDEVYSIAKPYTGKFILDYFFNANNSGNLNRLATTDDEKLYLLDRMIELIVSENTRFSDYDYGDFERTLKMVNNLAGNSISKEKVLKIFFDRKFFKNTSGTIGEYMSKYIDNMVATGYFEDPETIISYIQQEIPDYRGLSLIIMNKNVSIENRVKCLKKIYKQKDLPAFMESLRNSMTDLSVLDVFIEATIIQNNRVKEKDANIIKLWKNIFVSTETSTANLYDRNRNGKLTGKVEFSKKYIKYILDPVFSKKLYNECVGCMSTEVWRREKHWEEFLELITCSLSVDEKIKATENVASIKALGKRFPSMFQQAIREEDTETEMNLLKVFLLWTAENNANEIPNIFHQRSIDLEDYFESVKDKSVFNDFVSKYAFTPHHSQKTMNYGIPAAMTSERMVKTVFCNDESIKYAKIFDDEYIKTFGINVEKFSKQSSNNLWRNCRELGSLFRNSLNFYKSIEDIANNKLQNNITEKDKEWAVSIIERFFSCFEEENSNEAISSEILKYVRDFPNFENIEITNTSKNSYYYYSSSAKSERMDEYYIKIMDTALNAATMIYEIAGRVDPQYATRKVEAISNLSKAVNAVKLICCFEI